MFVNACNCRSRADGQVLNIDITEVAGVPKDADRATTNKPKFHFKEKRTYEPPARSQTKRRQISGRDAASHNETQTLTEMEELYWFAMALTGDPEFATRLVVDVARNSVES